MENKIETFNNNNVFISNNSFKQNKIIKKDLRFDVNSYINFSNLVCIGGESYLFGLTNNIVTDINHYTNSIHIYNDAIKNNKIYRKNLNNNNINYNTFNNISSGDLLLINIAKLNINLLNIINKRFYKKIIIINCHHTEFWKRIKLLTNYKLILRKQYISTLYFVTVNILEYKFKIPTFISLGTSCVVAYQLNNLGLRKESYPFDWTKFDINKLNYVLENNFKKFSDIIIHKFAYNHKYKFTKNTGSFILKNTYNVKFAHELLFNNSNDINNLKNKINNRIKRFCNKYNEYIYFIILDNNAKCIDLIKLLYNLDKYFKLYKILFISKKDPNISNNKLKYIYIDDVYTDWQYSHINWFNLIYDNY
jgi:hypothetical protein